MAREYTITLPPEKPPSYKILIGQDLFPQIAFDLQERSLGSRYAIIADSNTRDPHALALQEELSQKGITSQIFFFPEGEANKNAGTVNRIWNEMGAKGFNRDACVIAVGGGVTGDMAGFIAATYGRGMPYIQVPTSTISQVDSAIGGKTGIDIDTAKNMVGRIVQPDGVYIDVNTLLTLADRHYRSGLVEQVKHGVMDDTLILRDFENNLSKILDRDPQILQDLIYKNCRVKGEIVMEDPNERGRRRTCNWGHTVGHAVELLSEFDIHHGEAVAFGMMVAGEMALNVTGYPGADLKRQNDILHSIDVVPDVSSSITNESIVAKLAMDKKAVDGKPRFVFPTRNGQMEEFGGVWATHVEQAAIYAALEKVRSDISNK
jgi:3-dehydroquinate synthase